MQNDAEHLMAEVQRLDQLLQLALNGAAAGTAALTRVPDFAKKGDVKGVLPGANVVVNSVDLSAFPKTALAFQVQFVAEEGVLQQADAGRFTTTAQGGIAPFVAATTTAALVAPAGNFAAPNVAPTYTVVLNGTILEAHVLNNNPVNPINVRANFYADIEAF
jgi:hypothetical protein